MTTELTRNDPIVFHFRFGEDEKSTRVRNILSDLQKRTRALEKDSPPAAAAVMAVLAGLNAGFKDITAQETTPGRLLSPKAGATVVFLPQEKRFGLAMCCEKDHFNKRLGRHIAARRAWPCAAKESRVPQQQRRFKFSGEYDGPMEITDLRCFALELVLKASKAVGNPVGPFASLEEDQENKPAEDLSREGS